jgi:hypothetical protein
MVSEGGPVGTYRPDSEILQFIHDRMVNVHGENPLYDYMHEFRRIIERVKSIERRDAEMKPLFDELMLSWKSWGKSTGIVYESSNRR